MKYLFLFSVVFMLNSCCGSSKTTETAQDDIELSGKFEIISLNGNEVAGEDLYLNFYEKSRVSAETGCNNVASDFERNGNKINFSHSLSTKMYCEGRMENEKAIARTFSEAKTIKPISENQIIFLSEDGTELLRAKKIE